jgi:hypothetical protein
VILSATKNIALKMHGSLLMKKLSFWNIKSVNFMFLIASHMTRVFKKGVNHWIADVQSFVEDLAIFLIARTRIALIQ